MPTKIGQFEIQSELAKSSTSTVYKAGDSDGQAIALKAIQLSAFGESSATLLEALTKEVENVKNLSNSNITRVTSGSEIEGQFCASMEYVQGNSIATMLARGEGFSIWDLLDIGRQLCSGFDYASSQGVVHRSLEPAKIMCGWDGTVKILSFGVSSVGDFVQHVAGEPSPILRYMSPEQLRGEATDGRSNLFSLGAIFYEMVTETPAFEGADVDSLRQAILESMPAPPIQLNAKVHPLLSDLIMKALAKDPAQRYQTGRALLDDLENCKEKRPAAKKAEPPKGMMAPPQVRAAAQAKLIAPGGAPAPRVAATSAPKPAPPVPARPVAAQPAQAPKPPAAKPVASAAASASATGPAIPNIAVKPASSRLATPKANAAAAGVGASPISTPVPSPGADSEELVIEGIEEPSAHMSSSVAEEPPVETLEPAESEGPRIAVDPMMAEGPAAGPAGTSFSEISEMPPLKEVYIAPPPPPPPVEAPMAPPVAPTVYRAAKKAPEKPKVQPREVAGKAIKEIKTVPPQLMAYAIGGALALILIIGIGVTLYVHSQNDDDSGSTQTAAPVVQTHDSPVTQSAPPQQAAPAPVATQPAETQPAETAETAPAEATRGRRGGRHKAAAPVVTTGDLSVDSTPQGAQVTVDGQTDASWVTPFAMTNLQPGQHSVSVSKAGYTAESRSVNIASGAKANSIFHLAQPMATLIVKSNPAGANIYVDGREVNARTPAQVSVNKGSHVVLVRMSGYLDETMNAQFALGQIFNFSPTLRPLGNADSIKTVGKMGKLFGKGDKNAAIVSIHTSPKGAQIAINQHMLDKNSPVDVMVDPGNYEIDITMSGYAPIHRVINADRGNKTVVDEVLTPQ